MGSPVLRTAHSSRVRVTDTDLVRVRVWHWLAVALFDGWRKDLLYLEGKKRRLSVDDDMFLED